MVPMGSLTVSSDRMRGLQRSTDEPVMFEGSSKQGELRAKDSGVE